MDLSYIDVGLRLGAAALAGGIIGIKQAPGCLSKQPGVSISYLYSERSR